MKQPASEELFSVDATQPADWDARTYHRVSNPQFEWGLKVLARLDVKGTETVIDAGCGSGRLTAELLAKLPKGRVIALDVSDNMLAEARALLEPKFADRVSYVKADLADLQLGQIADGVFSTATFHWVNDHDRLFAGLYRALKPGGWLQAQCGGGRNLHRLHQRAFVLSADVRFAPYFADWIDPWNFADEDTTRARLQNAGFVKARVWIEEAPTPFADAAAFSEFLRTVVLRMHLARLPDPALKERFLEEIVREAAADDPPFVLDYWRLNVEARRPK